MGRFEGNGVLYKLGNLREMEYKQGSFWGKGVLGGISFEGNGVRAERF